MKFSCITDEAFSRSSHQQKLPKKKKIIKVVFVGVQNLGHFFSENLGKFWEFARGVSNFYWIFRPAGYLDEYF